MSAPSESSLLARWQLAKAASTDSRLSRSNVAVLFAVLDCLNGSTGQAWPGKKAIAAAARVHESTAKASIRRLVAFGYLIRESGSRGYSNRYRIGSAPPGCELAPGSESAPSGGLESKPPRGANRRPKGVSTPAPNILKNLLSEPTELNMLTGNRFADFWSAYPKKEGKPGAERAWQGKKLDLIADLILADLARSFGEGGRWKGTELKFVPMPATYLNNRRWEDEWTTAAKPGQVPRETRTEAEIEASNEEALQRIGGIHG